VDVKVRDWQAAPQKVASEVASEAASHRKPMATTIRLARRGALAEHSSGRSDPSPTAATSLSTEVQVVTEAGSEGPEADFASLLRLYRRRAGITQEQLGQLSGLSVRTIRNLELGQTRPYSDSSRRLSETLQLPAEARASFERLAGERRDACSIQQDS
jgi:DNA-binding XRE family transcriptional regulator